MALSKNNIAFIILIILTISLICCIYSNVRSRNALIAYYLYSTECPVCKQFDPIWGAAVINVSIKTVKINVREPKGQEMIRKYGINTVPTVIMVTPNGVKRFTGSRTVDSLRAFLLNP